MTIEEIKEYIRKRIVELGTPKDKDIYDFYRLKEITVIKSNDEKIDELEKVYDMLDQLDEQKISIDDIASKMRPATKEELEGIDEYIKEISVAIDDE